MTIEEKNIYVNVMLTEYSELRSEQRDVINRQYLIISWTVTLIGTLFGLSLYLDESLSEVLQNALFYVLIPCGAAFMGIFWMDHVYRQIRVGVYMLSIEKRINTILNDNYEETNMVLNWEHYLKKLKNGKIRSLSTNRLVHFFGVLLFISLLMASVIHVSAFLKNMNGMIAFSIIALFCYIGSGIKYYREIVKVYTIIKKEMGEE